MPAREVRRGGGLTKDKRTQHSGPCSRAVVSSVNFAFLGKKKCRGFYFFLKLIVLPRAAGRMRLCELRGTEAGSGQHPSAWRGVAWTVLHGSTLTGCVARREAAERGALSVPREGSCSCLRPLGSDRLRGGLCSLVHSVSP